MATTVTIILLLLIGVCIFFAFAPQIGAKPSTKGLLKLKSSTGFRKGQFRNVIETSVNMSFLKMAKTMYEMFTGDKGRTPQSPIETLPFDSTKLTTVGNAGEAAICWFGHSSLLIKIHGKVLLTDPVLVGKRASMVSFIGPHRFPYTNNTAVEELPLVDAVILSHDHYDHLDYPTILSLKDRVKQFIAPLGVGAHLEKWGVPPSAIREYDWWERASFDENIALVCAPSRHFSGRSLTSRNTTLWCSWVIEGRDQRFFFGADSGYSPTFSEIGKKFGPFDPTILECGAYHEYWRDIHMTPEETLQAHLDLKGILLMPVHWGKFSLSLHGWKEPLQRLQKKAAQTGVSIFSPQIGDIVTVDRKTKKGNWWESRITDVAD